MQARRRARGSRASAAAPRQSGAIAPAFGHAGARDDQRRVKRVRQQQRGRRSRRSDAAGRSSVSGDDLVDLRHQREERRDRGPRGDGDRRVADGARRTSAIAGSAMTASPSQFGANDHEAFHRWFNSINEDRAPADQSDGRRSRRQRAADRGRRGRRPTRGADLAVDAGARAGRLSAARSAAQRRLRQPQLGRARGAGARARRTVPPVLVGLPEPNPSDEGRPLFNTAVLLRGGQVEQRFRKALLPTYDVFDEDRYFEPFHGAQVLDIGGRAARHQHLRGHLERSRLLEAAPLPPRSDRGAGRAPARRRSSTCRRRRSPSASTAGARRCSAAWRASTACRSST